MEYSLDRLLENVHDLPLTCYTGPAFKMHNPVWGWSPLSMEGSRLMGGRFNPVGSPALYLGLSVKGCHAEVTSGATNEVLSPQLLCSYEVDIDGILDLREHYANAFSSAWRIDLLENRRPPGWVLHDEAMPSFDLNGILVPSYVEEAKGESNLVLFHIPKGTVTLHDPDGRLRSVYGSSLDI